MGSLVQAHPEAQKEEVNAIFSFFLYVISPYVKPNKYTFDSSPPRWALCPFAQRTYAFGQRLCGVAFVVLC